MKKYLILGIFLGASLTAYTQHGHGGPDNQQLPAEGILTGTVIDKGTNEPVEYASVVLFSNKDSAMINGVVTDNKGRFRIEKILFGHFYVKVNFIGYKTGIVSGVSFKQDSTEKDIGIIQLESSTSNLSEVEIKGEKDQIEYNLDKKVINVDKNLVTAGGTALDVMQTIPSVSVDIEGTVSLRGSSNVTILIDGRPSGMTSLDQLPAVMIDKVEIVTNPSARYDPDGMSGIINIVTKKKKEPGYNGMISINAGTGDKYTGSVNLNFRNNKINIFGNYSYRSFAMKGSSEMYRETFYNDTVSYLDQHGDWRRGGQFQNAKVGFDYFINKNNTLSLTGSFNVRNFKSHDETFYESSDYNNVLYDYYIRKSDSRMSSNGPEVTLAYKKTFKREGQELSASLYYSYSSGNNYYNNSTNPFNLDLTPLSGGEELDRNITNTLNPVANAQLDYVHPLKKWGRIETGYKFIFQDNNMDYVLENYDGETDKWITDETYSNHFVYDEQIHASYFIYSNNLGNFQYQAGIRAEEAMTTSKQRTTGETFHNDYFSIFPTVHLRYDFTEVNSMQISYSRRVNRPSSRSLNPFVNNSDPLNLSAGNPDLNPEYINSFELAWLLEKKITSVNATAFYRQTNNMISRYMVLLDSNVTFSTYRNIDKGMSYGLEFIMTHNLTKWWNVNLSGSIFGEYFVGAEVVSNLKDLNLSWNAKLGTTASIPKIIDVQVTFNYEGPKTEIQGGGRHYMSGGGQGRQAEMYWLEAGLKKDFFKNRFSASFRVSDILKSISYDHETWGANFNQTSSRKRESRVFYLGLSYKINGGLRQKGKRRQDENMDMFMEY